MQDVKNKTPAKVATPAKIATPAKVATPAKPADPFGPLVEMMMTKEIKVSAPAVTPASTTISAPGTPIATTSTPSKQQAATPKSASKKGSKTPLNPTPVKNVAPESSIIAPLPSITEVEAEVEDIKESDATDAMEVEAGEIEAMEVEPKVDANTFSDDDGEIAGEDPTATITTFFPLAPPPTPCVPRSHSEVDSAPTPPVVTTTPVAKKNKTPSTRRKLATPLRKEIQGTVSLKSLATAPAQAAPITTPQLANRQLSLNESPADTPSKMVDLKGLAEMMPVPQHDSSRLSVTIISTSSLSRTPAQRASTSHAKSRPAGTKIAVPVIEDDMEAYAVPSQVSDSLPVTTPAKVDSQDTRQSPNVDAEAFVKSFLQTTPETAKPAATPVNEVATVDESPLANKQSEILAIDRTQALGASPAKLEIPSPAKMDVDPKEEEEPAKTSQLQESAIVEQLVEPAAPVEEKPVVVEKATRGRKRKVEESEEHQEEQPKSKKAATSRREAKPVPQDMEVDSAAAPEPTPAEHLVVPEPIAAEISHPAVEEPSQVPATKGRGRKKAQPESASEVPMPAAVDQVADVKPQPEPVVAAVEEPVQVKSTVGRRGRNAASKESSVEPVAAPEKKEPSPAPQQVAERPTKRATRNARSQEPAEQHEPAPVKEVPVLEPVAEEPQETEEATDEEAKSTRTRTLRGKRVQKLEQDPEPTTQTRRKAATEESVPAAPRSTRGAAKKEEEEVVAEEPTATRSTRSKKAEDKPEEKPAEEEPAVKGRSTRSTSKK